jgi:hypothetical protein
MIYPGKSFDKNKFVKTVLARNIWYIIYRDKKQSSTLSSSLLLILVCPCQTTVNYRFGGLTRPRIRSRRPSKLFMASFNLCWIKFTVIGRRYWIRKRGCRYQSSGPLKTRLLKIIFDWHANLRKKSKV